VAKITIAEFDDLMEAEMPWAVEAGLALEGLSKGEARMRLPFRDNMLRPGGTVSGPSMMALADACMYAVILSEIGHVKLAVTTSLNINFLRKPGPVDLVADGTMLKLGKRLAVMEVTLHSEGGGDPVAHATGTYSIPPRES
jgi:uncharacterized protein (TIGR00369 family)